MAARAHDTTHSYGITMSHSWVYHLINKIAADAKEHLRVDVRTYPFRASHDNLNINHQVYEQRTDNQTRHNSGTAATVYIIKDPNVVWPDHKAYQTHRAKVAGKIIDPVLIWKLERDAAPRLRVRAIHQVLKFLTDAAPFDFETYEFRDSDVFSPPPPRDQLPTGPESTVIQYMLDTVAIESASQEGTRKCLDEWMRQLGLDGPEEVMRDDETLKKLLVWIGDQLTTVRIRSVKKDREEDFNPEQRLECFFEVFGWFHAQLAEETSIHKQYYAAHKPYGLQHGFEILKRKGLHSTSVKGMSLHY